MRFAIVIALLLSAISCSQLKPVLIPPLPTNITPKKMALRSRVLGINEGHESYQTAQPAGFPKMVDFDQGWIRSNSFPDDVWNIWHSTNLIVWAWWTNVPLTVKTVQLQNLPQEYFIIRVTNTFTGWTSGWTRKRY